MKRFINVTAALNAVLLFTSVLILGCGEPPTEIDLRSVADSYILVIDEIYKKSGSFPGSIDQIHRVMSAELRIKSNPAGYSIRYYHFRTSKGVPAFRIAVGDIIDDRRELHFDSETSSWFYDS